VFDIPILNQRGFSKGKNIFDNLEDITKYISYDMSLANFDLENSFNQINTEQVYSICRYIFDLNEKDSLWFAKQMTYKNELFQGNPLSPLIFNIWTARLIYVLDRCNVDVTQYADDIFIVGKYDYFSNRYLKFIAKIIHEMGFKTNVGKTSRQRKYSMRLLGLRLYNNKDYGGYGVYAKNLKRFRNNLRLWKHLENLGIKNTRRLSKSGKPIMLKDMQKGLLNWIESVSKKSSVLGFHTYTLTIV